MASDLSNAAQVAGTLTQGVSHAISPPPADVSSLPATVVAQASYSWLGLFGWLIWFTLHVVSTILYWVIRIATINFPSILYHLFSTSWTVTMNATTLYACCLPLSSCVVC